MNRRSSYQGLKRFWLLKTHWQYLEETGSHFWIKINLWAELEGNPSYWVAFSIFVLAFVFSPFHLFSFFIAFFIIYLAAVRRPEKILKAQRLPKGEDVCIRCWFSLPSTLFLSYCRCKRPLWFFPHQRTVDATWCIMLKSLVNPLISVLLKTKRTEKG